MATTRPELVEACKTFMRDIKRLGFKQYRADGDGVLYGMKVARIKVPYSVGRGLASLDQLGELSRKVADEVQREVALFGPLKPNPEDLKPVEDIEAILEEGGQPDADSEAMNLAGEGSTPSPPAMETAGLVPDVAIIADEGSTPSGLPTPNQEETTTMAKPRLNKRGRRYPDPWTCPKCGETFQAQGRHAANCTGKPRKVKTPRVRSAPEQTVTLEEARQNGHGTLPEALQAFKVATDDLMLLIRSLEGEVVTYRRENEELRAFKQRASALFEPVSKVPRG